AQLAPASRDPYTDPDTLARAVEIGLLDAPHLRGNAAGCGKIVTRMIGGACMAAEPGTGKAIPEAERIAGILAQAVPRRVSELAGGAAEQACGARHRRAEFSELTTGSRP